MVKGFPSRKDSIILAVIDIINESGVQGLSTKEIAAKQGISESLLYKHFKSLDEVLVAVIQYYSRFDTMIMNTVQNRDISCKEKILEFTKSFVELYESYPALAAIILNYETLMHYGHTRDMVIDIINKRTDFVTQVLETGLRVGEFEKYYTAQELTDIVMGTIRTMILRWKMSGHSYPLKADLLITIKKVLDRC
ncbi:MAG: TetR/AcrR family transcriptional regulator [Clostridiaceae bacterium]|jgi:AcrR family transcriptional regulator|nr:TetR/AcrR family transcriptional regulator [Clostridiaceae bacterium]